MRGPTISLVLLASAALLALAGCASNVSDASVEPSNGSPHDPVVAVVDGGISGHWEMAGRVVGRWSAPRLERSPSTPHATRMASIVLGVSEPRAGTEAAVRLLDVRVLDQNGLGEPEDIAAGVRWAVSQRPDFMLLSMSLTADNPKLREAIKGAVASGVTVIASTANGIGETRAYPAEYPGVVGVTSLTSEGRIAPLAGARGAKVAALGHRVKVPQGEQYVEVSGTSVAAATATRVLATCAPHKERGARGAVRYAHASGEQTAAGIKRIPVLLCLPQKG